MLRGDEFSKLTVAKTVKCKIPTTSYHASSLLQSCACNVLVYTAFMCFLI